MEYVDFNTYKLNWFGDIVVSLGFAVIAIVAIVAVIFTIWCIHKLWKARVDSAKHLKSIKKSLDAMQEMLESTTDESNGEDDEDEDDDDTTEKASSGGDIANEPKPILRVYGKEFDSMIRNIPAVQFMKFSEVLDNMKRIADKGEDPTPDLSLTDSIPVMTCKSWLKDTKLGVYPYLRVSIAVPVVMEDGSIAAVVIKRGKESTSMYQIELHVSDKTSVGFESIVDNMPAWHHKYVFLTPNLTARLIDDIDVKAVVMTASNGNSDVLQVMKRTEVCK